MRSAAVLIWLGVLAIPLASVAQDSVTSAKTAAADGASKPKVIFAPEPEFSEQARKKKLAGSCTLSVVVGNDGLPRDVTVVHSIAEGQPPKLRKAALSLDQKAIEAVKQYRFEPAMLARKPVAATIQVEVNFQISEKSFRGWGGLEDCPPAAEAAFEATRLRQPVRLRSG